ncbi:MAG: hypothetical protein PHZ02_01550 [Desulfocapsaceae bacterium]|nr:hypothetical protein [Desulfocapsaceae bacterium]
MKPTDEKIIKILHNAWDHNSGPNIADAQLTTAQVAAVLTRSPGHTLSLLKELHGRCDKIKGNLHGKVWLWRYNGKMISYMKVAHNQD